MMMMMLKIGKSYWGLCETSQVEAVLSPYQSSDSAPLAHWQEKYIYKGRNSLCLRCSGGSACLLLTLWYI